MSDPAPTPSLLAPRGKLQLVLRLVVAFLLGQTLFFKFTAAPESVALFEQLGAEPWGRWGTGLAELVAVVALLVPRTAGLGALLALGLMTGAIGSHLVKLGIVVGDDGGALFAMACVAWVSSAAIAWIHRSAWTAFLPGARKAQKFPGKP